MQSEHKLRIAIGVFSEWQTLRRTLDELESCGLAADEVVVLADAGALDGALSQNLVTATGDGHAPVPHVLLRGRDRPGAGSPPCSIVLDETSIPAERLLNFETWIAPRLSRVLDSHLADGACMLIAPVATPQHEWLISSSLLRHSLSPVQLHDLSLRP